MKLHTFPLTSIAPAVYDTKKSSPKPNISLLLIINVCAYLFAVIAYKHAVISINRVLIVWVASVSFLLLMLFIVRWMNEMISRQKNKQDTTGKTIHELEMKAIRAQMNTHFIFNCMNSIKTLIQQKEEDKAITYLTTFSKLIRTIFQNSDKREITLHDEIETCKLYTQLESMRFADKFNYAFCIDETIDMKLLLVPALIIQPFIENAIWHGIMPKKDGGSVNITIKRSGENVLCIIDDNGRGRETSKQHKFKAGGHESKGMYLTQSRIALNNSINHNTASLEIIDKKDEKGNATGTKVILTFKED
jgi:sensor histidine kinase YesM